MTIILQVNGRNTENKKNNVDAMTNQFCITAFLPIVTSQGQNRIVKKGNIFVQEPQQFA